MNSIEEIARDVLAGKYGDGEERKRKLGCLYDVVQEKVNQMCLLRDEKSKYISTLDNINKPSHYQGKNGMEAIDVVRNFIGQLTGTSAFYWGNAMKYLLRFQGKNGLEDLKKARKNLDWLIEEMEKEQ